MKITISLASMTRTPKGLEEDTHEWAVHQLNFDRDQKFSAIKKQATQTRVFTADEVETDEFLRGVERAERTANKQSPILRGSIDWN